MRCWVAFSVMALTAVGCGGSGKGSGNSFIYQSARKVAPAIKATATTSPSSLGLTASDAPVDGGSTLPWYSGNLGGLIYQSMQDYVYPDDEGKVDMLDIYKLLFETGQMFDAYSAQLDPITEQAIAAPFDFGATSIADTYDHAKNGVGTGVNMATRVVGNDRHFLITMTQDNGGNGSSNGTGYSILQGKYNGDTGDLELNFLMVLRYTSGSIYAMRTYLKGNDQTHTFDLRIFMPGGNSSMPDMHYLRSFIGTGVSEGAGNYYLFYGEDQSYQGATPPAQPGMAGYWCFAATATEADYQQAMTVDNVNGTNPVPDTCTTQQTHLDTDLKPGLWHIADFVTDMDPSNFTGGGTDHLELSF